MRRPAPNAKQPKAQARQTDFLNFPAPLKGWVETQSLAANDPTSALLMDNFFPTLSTLRVRGGIEQRNDLGARIRGMFSYETGTARTFFAFADGQIWELDPTVIADTPTSVVGSLSNVMFSTAQMGTVGGEFLYFCNGVNAPRLYDGSTWATITGISTPAITGVTTTDLEYVWKHKTRLWFTQKSSLKCWYLPVDSVGGAAGAFSLAGVFQKGGEILFGANWSADSGDGMDDRMVFVSTLGEVAIYQGGNPASAADWALVGVYTISTPIGPRAHVRVAGDLMIATVDGIVPLSSVVNTDPGSLDAKYVTRPIEKSWRAATSVKSAVDTMEMIRWAEESMLFVTMPSLSGVAYVANAATGAWCRYLGWNASCGVVYRDQLYIGSSGGQIYAAEYGGTDDGAYYIARVSYSPINLKRPAEKKYVGAMRSTFLTASTINPQMSVGADYRVAFPAPPAVGHTGSLSTSFWDVGLWDVAVWDDGGEIPYSSGWVSVTGHGNAIAPQVELAVSGVDRPKIDLVQLECLLEIGGTIG